MTKFPEYKYGGKKSDYVIRYMEWNSHKYDSTLVGIRKKAIASEYAYLKYNPINGSYGSIPTKKYTTNRIEAINLFKAQGFLQMSGRTKTLGHIAIFNDGQSKHDTIYWIDTVRKSDSRVIDRNGKVVRKLTAEEKRSFL